MIRINDKLSVWLDYNHFFRLYFQAMELTTSWLDRFSNWVANMAPDAACAVCFPMYRPDMVQDLAKRLQLQFVDFRALHMIPLGWQASTLTTQDMERCIAGHMAEGRGVVLQNLESLLSFLDAQSRQKWLAKTLSAPWPHRLVLPLALYAQDVPSTVKQSCYTLVPFEMPQESLLERLPGLR